MPRERDRPRPDDPTPPAAPRVVRARRGAVVLVCGKCVKRADEGRAIRRALAEAASERLAARAAAGTAERTKVRFARTACLGLCPKRAVVAASAATLAQGTMVVVAHPGEAARAAEILLPAPSLPAPSLPSPE